MAQDLEKLVISLEANLKQYERELARAQNMTISKMRGIEKQAQASATKIERGFARIGASIKSSIAGALGAITIGSITRNLIDLVNKFGDLADEAARAGVSAEWLQEIGLAAMGAGVNVGEMTDLIQKFNLEIGEAATKGGALKDLLDANNVALRDANGEIRSTQELFLEVTDLIANARTQQEASVVAMLAFGKAAKDALPFLQQGSAEIRAGMVAAKATGAVVDEELVKAADEFSDAWNYAWAVFEGKSAQAVLGAIKEMSAFDQAFRQTAVFKIFSRGGLIHQALGGAETLAPAESQRAPTLGTGGKSDQGQFTIIPEQAPKAAAAIKSVGDAAVDTSTDLEDMLNSMTEVDQEFLVMQDYAKQLEGAFQDAFRDLVEGARDGKLGLQDLLGVLDSLSAKLLQMAADKLFQLLLTAIPGSTGAPSTVGLISGMAGRQSGGHVNANQPYKVGEHGAEMFIPSQSGTINPNASGMAAAPIINIVNQPGVASTQKQSKHGGRDVIDIVNSVVESRFPDLLNRNSALISSKPASRRTV